MVKNIIFDFGAVLIPIEEERSEKAFAELGALPTLAKQKALFKKLETGKIEPTAFLSALKPHFFRKKIISNDLARAWSAICYCGIPEESINFLKTLRKQDFKLFLLSNTNALHIKQIKELSGLFTYHQFVKQFEKVYYSHEVGLSKPDKKIYQLVLKENKLKPEECFFTDDREENVKAAEKLGLNTFHYLPEEHSLRDIAHEIKKLA